MKQLALKGVGNLADLELLIVDDEVEVVKFFRRLLKKSGFSVTYATSGHEALACVSAKKFDVAVVDLKLPDTDGLTLLKKIKENQPACEVIIMTGYSTTRTAVKAIQMGAFDYLEKPFDDIREVEDIIERAAVNRACGTGDKVLNAEWLPLAQQVDMVLGPSLAVQRVVSVAYKIAKKNINVLIQGETGTGKEVLARFIHAASMRAGQPFIAVNCGALPENLLESELFGHEKGAFTGAGSARRGIFELANRGTLFLDEIGEASPSIQVKLLRVLETGEFLRVGGEKPVKTDVRIIAATNVNLEKAVKEKAFREDLFYRLDVVRLEVPPLRERAEDIPFLVEYFVKKQNPELYVSAEAMQIFTRYPWPGNVRELANTVNQAAALCDGKIILPEHINEKVRNYTAHLCGSELPADGQKDAGQTAGSREQEMAGEKNLVNFFELLGSLESKLNGLKKPESTRERPMSLAEAEKKAISEALEYCRGNITMTAKILGIGRNTLYRKIKEYKIVLNNYDGNGLK